MTNQQHTAHRVPTAIEVWSWKLYQTLNKTLFKPSVGGAKVIPIRVAVDRSQKAINEAVDLITEKHITILNALSAKLSKAYEYENNTMRSIKATSKIRFLKRRKLNEEYALAVTARMAVQDCILVFSNTPPQKQSL